MPRTDSLANPDTLRRCIRNVVALSALPAAWRNHDMRQMGDSIVAALISMLDADFVCIGLPGRGHDPIVKLGRGGLALPLASLISILRRGATTSGGGQEFVIVGGSGASNLHVMTAPIGVGASLAAASARETFPTKEERLLLDIGANQAAIAFQQWLGEIENSRFTAVAQRATDFIGIASLAGKVEYVNPAGLQKVGLASPDDAIRLEIGDFVSLQYRKAVRDELWPSVLSTGRWKGELELQHFGSGAAISFLVDSFRIDDPRTGKPMNVATVGRDLTERKASEAMLRSVNETLERRVEQRTSDLADANRRLVAGQQERLQTDFRFQQLQNEVYHAARLTAAGQMAAALAHQLNQPLTAVVNSVNAVKRLLEGRVDLIVAREVMGEAAGQALRASEIVRSLRQFLTRDEMQRRVEGLASMIEEASALAVSSVAPMTVRVRFDFDDNAGPVSVNRVQIQQVLVNLIRNACEAMANQAIREVVLATRALAEGAIEITVTDIGPGIPQEMTQRLFLPFASTKEDGMGMGLSISRSIVEAHGGQLTAKPNPLGGTIFRFTLAAGVEPDGE
jgi:signal transduction histidine kinase/PAS domain-containing protein